MTKPELIKTVVLVVGLSISIPALVTAAYLGYSRMARQGLPKYKSLRLTSKQSIELETLLDLPKLRSRPILLEVGDYQCPACRQAQQWVDFNEAKIARLADYRFVNLPLDQHEFAPLASKVAMAGRNTGSSRQIHHWLMQATDLREANLKKYVFSLENGGDIWSRAHSNDVKSLLDKEKRVTVILDTAATPSFYTLYPDDSISQTFLVTDILSVLDSSHS